MNPLGNNGRVRAGRHWHQHNSPARKRGDLIAQSYLSRRFAMKRMVPLSPEQERQAIAEFIRKKGVLKLTPRPNGAVRKRRVRE